MRNTSTLFRSAAFSQETGEAFILLITISHVELAQAIRITSNGAGVVSRGNTYVAYPFEIELPDDGETSEPAIRLSVDNISREILMFLRSLHSPATVVTEIVIASQPDTVEAVFPDFKLRMADYDALAIEGTLTLDVFAGEPYPKDLFSPDGFPGLF